MKLKYIILTAGLIPMAGCSYTGVKTLGAGVYEVTNHGVTFSQSTSELKKQAIAEAKAYCLKQGLTASIIEADKEGGGYGKLPESDVQFRCKREN